MRRRSWRERKRRRRRRRRGRRRSWRAEDDRTIDFVEELVDFVVCVSDLVGEGVDQKTLGNRDDDFELGIWCLFDPLFFEPRKLLAHLDDDTMC